MSPNNAGRIMIVDDQKNWRELLRILLEKEGFLVTTVESFGECQDAFQQDAFDVVILDVRLIDQDTFNVEGLALLHEIRAKSPSTKAVILTGYPDSIKNESGADAVLLKVPLEKTFDRSEFKDLVKKLASDAVSERNG
jgi:DNA-binding NtrC family response regulator